MQQVNHPHPDPAHAGSVDATEQAVREQAAPKPEQPNLLDAMRELGEAGRSGAASTSQALTAFRDLVTADISLARSAFGRAMAFTGLAIVFGASAWMLLMAALIAFLANKVGLAWTTSLLITGLASTAIALLGGWIAMRYFEHTRLQASRRQLARLKNNGLSLFGQGTAASQPDADAAHAASLRASGQTPRPPSV